jgi:hypothetical protein
MADEQHPRTANELRTVCKCWPLTVVRRAVAAVVRRAVAAVVPEPDAASIAAWLTDPDATQDAPPLAADAIGEIVRQIHAQRH